MPFVTMQSRCRVLVRADVSRTQHTRESGWRMAVRVTLSSPGSSACPPSPNPYPPSDGRRSGAARNPACDPDEQGTPPKSVTVGRLRDALLADRGARPPPGHTLQFVQ